MSKLSKKDYDTVLEALGKHADTLSEDLEYPGDKETLKKIEEAEEAVVALGHY